MTLHKHDYLINRCLRQATAALLAMHLLNHEKGTSNHLTTRNHTGMITISNCISSFQTPHQAVSGLWFISRWSISSFKTNVFTTTLDYRVLKMVQWRRFVDVIQNISNGIYFTPIQCNKQQLNYVYLHFKAHLHFRNFRSMVDVSLGFLDSWWRISCSVVIFKTIWVPFWKNH